MSSEFGRLTADDELCAAVEKAVREEDADALRRLGLDRWGDYVQRLSELMGESVRDGLEPSDDFGALMSQVASPARYAHHLVCESGAAVQTAKDEPLGIHLKPLEPGFDDEALKDTVGTAVSMDDPAQTVGILADGLAYAVKKAGNEFVGKNAEQRSRAGFEVSVKRSGASKCCEWCAARIGSWALKNAPDDIFGCHANCSCVVEYTNSTGVTTQRRGTGRFVDVEYEPPHVMTYEEAKEKGGFDEPKRLTGGANGGIMYADAFISPNEAARKVKYNLSSELGKIEIISNALNDLGFVDVSKDFFTYVDPKLQLSIVEQLEKLEDRFKVIHISKTMELRVSNIEGVAEVIKSKKNPLVQSLVLSDTHYNNFKEHLSRRRTDLTSGFCMPCRNHNDTLSKYVITHEYGHMIENMIAGIEMNLTGATFDELTIKYRNEILNIAKTSNPNFDLLSNMSDRSKKNEREFFAECFANCMLGKPNELGAAMNVWLKRRGL